MKTFQEFVLECYSIQETSLTRVMSKSKKGGMAIMSAQRGDKSSSENKARSKQLERDIRGAGLPGPTKVAGRYTENPGTPEEKKVGEKSHIITPGKKGKRKFKKAIEKLGKKYDQEQTLIGLGLNKLHRKRILLDTPSIRGMVNKVKHLVIVEEVK